MDYPKSVANVGLVNGKFVDEDSAAGVVGSLIPAEWGNSVTDEILAVIAAAGLAPSESETSQLLTAIASIASKAAPAATEEKAGIASIATSADFDEGVDDSKFVTVKKIKLWFGGFLKQATESALGLAKISSQAQVTEGQDDTTIVTPKKLRYGFSASIAKSGYIALPTWMSGVVIQWGAVTGLGKASTGAGVAGPTKTVTLPVTFPTEGYVVITSMNFDSMATTSAYAPGAIILNKSQISLQNNYTSSAGELVWLAIGR
ncbi:MULTISPECIES: hypothetical protein [unclassified Pseudomonas]|uniref:gp53-like domain-containing protein n=1 Tax=unclassified Pseudomonas TaxID=196821 RepID=UPI000BDC1F76|nr:hypothetical protein F474_03442 [Pseudomonas sp. URIL14HWK12:I12]PVZ23212.1 hypothetical protein F470_02761 [Pseudomonas sp. URIL14HWK12:I10]PVZ32541.1 hypothetical protein F472_03108 [Pseudomonas sp. URIL14HWK12:I11]SNZ13630.1 hypothetical protein SAMN05660463_02457 [Pseudomonas sp. URIL14HWK12:I9]